MTALGADPRYVARSASDHTDDWPFWFVKDTRSGGVNVTGQLFERLAGEPSHGRVFMTREGAIKLAALANEHLTEARLS